MRQLSKDDDMKQKCNALADLFMSNRQIGEAQAYYQMLPHMNLTYSSVKTVVAPTVPAVERRHWLQRQDPQEGRGFKVNDKDGLFLEKADLVTKYERRKLLGSEEDIMDDDTLEGLTYCQFVKMYESRGGNKNEEGEYEQAVEDANPEEGELAQDDGYNFVVTGEELGIVERKRLPQAITLSDPLPGEPLILHKRSFPRVLRLYKQRLTANPHKFYLAELMLYHPFRREEELFPDDEEKCEELFKQNDVKIKRVKAELMPFMESVDEAQQLYEENRENEEMDIVEAMGPELDPEWEQEDADGEDEEDEDHSDYYHLDPNQVQDDTRGAEGSGQQVFKPVILPEKDDQVANAKLDCMQRCVIILLLR